MADPGCHPAQQSPPVPGSGQRPPFDMMRISEENGKQVLTLRPDEQPAGLTLVFIANENPNNPGLWGIGGVPGTPPTCMPQVKPVLATEPPFIDGKPNPKFRGGVFSPGSATPGAPVQQ